MPITADVQGFQRLQELRARIKEAGDSGMNRKFRSNVRKAGQPVVANLQAKVMTVKVTSSRGGKAPPDRSTGLRARTASTIKISQTRNGIRIVVSAKKFGLYGVTLPRYLDAELAKWTRWRYPVFWKGQMGTAPSSRIKQQTGQHWFFATIRKDGPAFEKAVDDVMDETERELSR